ncbi:hypothetical protein GQ457_14G012210 [Hibiscus cannabinus]
MFEQPRSIIYGSNQVNIILLIGLSQVGNKACEFPKLPCPFIKNICKKHIRESIQTYPGILAEGGSAYVILQTLGQTTVLYRQGGTAEISGRIWQPCVGNQQGSVSFDYGRDAQCLSRSREQDFTLYGDVRCCFYVARSKVQNMVLNRGGNAT